MSSRNAALLSEIEALRDEINDLRKLFVDDLRDIVREELKRFLEEDESENEEKESENENSDANADEDTSGILEDIIEIKEEPLERDSDVGTNAES